MQKVLTWAQEILTTKGYKPQAAPHMLRSVPWSTVWRFDTPRGKVYLKCVGQEFAYEAALLSFLTKQKFPHLPIVLATHPIHKCFLMQDAGDSLQRVLETNYDISLVSRLLKAYAQIQKQCIPLVDQLLSIGLRDLSPKTLPASVEALLANSDLGFNPDDMSKLRNSQASLTAMCMELDSIGIPPTLEHGDLDDDNILIKDNAITFLDFGDATVSHPFFSLAAFLNGAQSHHGLHPSSQQYLALRDAYLEEWQSYAPHNKLVGGFELANALMTFIWMFGLQRIQSCPGIDAAEYGIYTKKVMQHYYATFLP